MVTRTEVAYWMVQRLLRHGSLDRHEVVVYLREKCGGAFLHRTRYGAGTLNERLLAEFHLLRPAGVVWLRGEHRWQLDRRPTLHPPG